MTNDSKVRAYTMKEVRGEFLTNIYATQSVLDKQENRDGLTIAYTVLNMIDQGEPLFEIITSNDNKDIAGVLHSLILENDEQLNEQEQYGKITPVQKAFVNEIRRLAHEYDIVGMNDSHILTTDILRLIDQGIDGVQLQLKALGTEDDIKYYSEMGTNYYPLEGENISGKLAYEYGRIVDACRIRNQELYGMIPVSKNEISRPKHF